MSILVIGPEEINRRKTHSDIKNQTDDLTFSNRERGSSHGEAAKKVRDRKYVLEIRALMRRTEESEFNEIYDELLKGVE